MPNMEMHQRTIDVLVKLVDVLNQDELSLLCWHCGISTNELMPVDQIANPQTVVYGEEPF